jgi:hypothetical protein
MHCDHSWYIVLHIWVLIISGWSTRTIWKLPAETPSSEVGETLREMAFNVAYEVSLFIRVGLTYHKILPNWADGFLLPRRKSCCGFLSRLNVNHPRQGLNPRTLGPMTTTLTTRPPKWLILVRFSVLSLWRFGRESNPWFRSGTKVLGADNKGAPWEVWLNAVVEWLTLLFRILKVRGSSLSPETSYYDWGFSWASSVPSRRYRDNALN